MNKTLRSARRSLEIAVLELVARAIRPEQRRWVAAVAAVVLLPTLAVAATLAQHASAHPGRTRPATAAQSQIAGSTPPSAGVTLDPALFQAAARRAPAAPALSRLPQVDLNGLSVSGIPRAALAAYVTAARMTDRHDPTCRVRWWLLAGIGLVESGHARSGGSAQRGWNGIARPPIFGPLLDGKRGTAVIHDTDHGALDRDRRWDRAVGPMQFLPSTWQRWGGSDRGRPRDPQDIRAAALAAAGYLCAGRADLSRPPAMATAVYGYNHSFDYVRLVLTVAARYAGIDPAALGVDRLPHDKARKARTGTRRPSPSPTTSPTTSASPASPAGPDGSPSAAPAPASTPTGSPQPTGGTSLPPVPSPTGTPLFL
jgi:membrane-bound lytic murein transglycosylase B